MPRVLAVFLDGFEQSLGLRYMASGDMPALQRLRERSAVWLLDHGAAQRTGLAGEHFSTGQSPETAGRWAAVDFDPRSYGVWQVGTAVTPFPARLPIRTVVFDPPYFRLEHAPGVRGIVNWGAHDPGVATGANPASLLEECRERFGEYPARKWIYGFAWPSEQRTRAMGSDLADAVDARRKAALWLLGERLPDWDLGIVTVSEPHSVIEGLFHGVDPAHPLNGANSGPAAREGIRAVYRAVDRLVGELADAFPDAALMVFSMGGMGPNRSDAASMLLLPELLYRNEFRCPLFQSPAAAHPLHEGPVPLGAEEQSWEGWIRRGIPTETPYSIPAVLLGRLPYRIRQALLSRSRPRPPAALRNVLVSDLDWMPARAYQRFWKNMRFFALPSFYDGRVRINLQGREEHGRVGVDQYRSALAEVEQLVRECVDPATGQGVVDFVEFAPTSDPIGVGPTESDLVIVWKNAPLCLDHPRFGRIGPVPYRRTGGHTGPHGVAYLRGQRAAVGDHGVASSFDVVPTLIDLLGCDALPEISGTSLLAARS